MVGGGERVEDVVDDEQALVCSLGTHNPRPNSPASAFCVGEVTSRFSARLPANGNCTRLEKKILKLRFKSNCGTRGRYLYG